MNAPFSPPNLSSNPRLVERRERRLVSLKGFAARSNGDVIEIVVVDLSYEGCCVETPVSLKAGETIKFSVLGRVAIEAEVRWADNGRAGLLLTAAGKEPEFQRPRAADRISVTAEISTRRVGGPRYVVRTLDLSSTGCRIELADRPSVGERMFVKFSMLEVLEARVCWIEGGQAGLSFAKSIHPAVFQLLLQHLRP